MVIAVTIRVSPVVIAIVVVVVVICAALVIVLSVRSAALMALRVLSLILILSAGGATVRSIVYIGVALLFLSHIKA